MAEKQAPPAAAIQTVSEEEQIEKNEMVVTIENVMGKIDYDRLVEKFGLTLIDDSLME